MRPPRAHVLSILLATSALAPGLALAQEAPAAAAPAPAAPAAEATLGEVVVTATRRNDTVNRVALSITAQTQRSLDQQGVRSVQDLSRIVPSLTIRRSDNNNIQPAIRGIIASGGAPTTGVYLDDTPLQKRNGIGATVGNGSPFPPLFDLERVEVLRGPQGTLFGGSSEGGTIRFITPAPSVSRYSAYVRAQASTTQGGDNSGEIGLAVGGPILRDKIGFRISGFTQHQGGYLDHIDQYTGVQALANTNSEDTQVGRLAFVFIPIPQLKITPAVYASVSRLNDASPSWLNQPATTTPARYFTATGAATTAGAANVAYAYPSRTYGPYNFYGPNKAGGVMTSPATSRLFVPSLTLDYDLGFADAHSVTSYIQDQQIGVQNLTPSNEIPGLQAGVPYVAELGNFPANFHYENRRRGITQEVRLASKTAGERLTWVGGVFFADLTTDAYNYTTEDLDALTRTLRGVSPQVVYGAPVFPGGVVQIRDQDIKEREIAAFANATYAVTEKLKLTAGVRVSQNEMTYNQSVSGAISGYAVPTLANGGIASGKIKETPVTPKFGVEYQLTSRDLLYVTATKGFRPGGVNLSVPTNCAPQLAAAGLTSTPSTYANDSVWAYEAGAKSRVWGGRAQINTSVFYIDWQNIQYSVGVPGCVFTYTSNAGSAVSQGADVQANVRLLDNLTADVSASYTDAHYTQDIRGPAAPGRTGSLLVGSGNTLPTPPWQVQAGLRYDFRVMGRGAYLRGDYQYASAYHTGLGPGTTTYAPDTYNSPATNFVSARAGVAFSGWDLSIFANNLTNSQDLISYTGPTGGRYSCSNLSCTSFANYSPLRRGVFYRPREVGVMAVFRY